MRLITSGFLILIGSIVLAQTPVTVTIQAEHFSALQGVTFTPPVKDGKGDFETVNGFGNGDWARYDDMNFGDGAFTSVILYYPVSYSGVSAARVYVRTDSATGTIIATINGIASGTHSSAAVAATAGVHSVYLTFSGPATIIDLDKFCFSGTLTINPNDAKTYYVSTHGSDANDGLSLNTPFRTITRAASVMRPGGRCLIRQGIYRETVKDIFSGVAGAPLTFQPYNSELVYIDGADPVAGWTNHAGNIYKAPMTWNLGKYKNQIIVDGKMAWVARCPNVDDAYQPHPWLSWCNGGPGCYKWQSWQQKTEPIAVPMGVCWSDNGTFTYSMYVRDPNNPAPAGFDMAVEDASEAAYKLPAGLFNRAADFFKGGLISLHNNWYWMNAGEITGSQSASATKTVITANRTDLMEKDGGGAGWISHVFGLLDAPNEWFYDSARQVLYLIAPDGGDPSAHLVEAKNRPLGFDLRGKQYVNVNGLYFIATSMSLADASHCVIDGCHFKYVSHNDNPPFHELGVAYAIKQESSDGHLGVYISGDNNVIKNSAITGSASSGVIMNGAFNTITNCIVTACDYSGTYNAGILLAKRDWGAADQARGLQVTHNSLAFNARANLQVGCVATPATAADRTIIKYNDFGAAVYTSTESGSIAGQSSHEVDCSYNWFHDVAGSGVGSIVMESDFGATGWIVHHNVFWQGFGPASEGGFIRGFDWTFTWPDTGTSAQLPNAGGAMCFNNTVVDEVDPVHRDWEYDWPGYKKNNIMARGDTAAWKFTDPVSRDYTLRSGSPAIDKGVAVPGWVETWNGAAPDMGAYEYGSPRWTAGADWKEQPWTYPPPDIAAAGRPESRMTGAGAPWLRIVRGAIIAQGERGKTVRAVLFDALGAMVASVDGQEGTVRIPTDSFARGIYFARVSSCGHAGLWKITNMR